MISRVAQVRPEEINTFGGTVADVIHFIAATLADNAQTALYAFLIITAYCIGLRMGFSAHARAVAEGSEK